MAHLFPKNALREQASRIPTVEVKQFIEIVEQWRDDYRVGTLRKDTETSREQAYNQHFFIEILKYRQKPEKSPTFVPKETTRAGQQPDAVIAVFGGDAKPDAVSAVVELKSADVDLDRPQKREGHLSPVQQGFKYKVQYRRCPFVIVSNYWEFRLYADNMLDFEAWTLDDLCDPEEDYLKFKTWYFLLRAENFVGLPVFPTQRFLSDIRVEREQIGKRFYARYKHVRLEFLRKLQADNPRVRSDIGLGIRVTQKVMDRVVFAAFAEDTGLLPDNAIAKLQRQAEEGFVGLSLWDVLKRFFHAIDKGDTKLDIPVGYNGGLFADDPELDELTIDEDQLRDVLSLSQFDFGGELTVTVLGHILEQSITDLEEIRSKELHAVVESQQKKEGIYYTPDHVVQYIVDNSLGRYLREQEDRCKKDAGLLTGRGLSDKTFDERTRKAYHEYQTVLQSVRVLDPACGSGAFLVGALELLQAENQRVGAILGGTIFDLNEFAQAVLRDNLYGVDLNPEGVEITKLSLWLKTAQRGHVLSDLDENIRVGNSLVDDPLVADKAFNWDKKFPNVNGFDVVIGNPPYVDSESMTRNDLGQRKWLATHCEAARGNWDLYVVFIARALQLVKPDGFVSMIVPNKVLSAPYASALRRIITDKHRLISITDVSHDGVFDVDVYPVIVGVAADHDTKRTLVVQEGIEDREAFRELDGDSLPDNWGLLLPSTERVTFNVPTVAISEWFDTWAAATVSEAYELALSEDPAAKTGKVINTGTIDPFHAKWGFELMTYLKKRYMFPTVNMAALSKHKDWHGKNKLIVNGMGTRLEAVYCEADTYFPAKSTVVITAKDGRTLSLGALCALLNSRYVSYLFEQDNRLNAMSGGYMTINHEQLGKLRIPQATPTQDKYLSALAVQLDADNQELALRTQDLQDAVRSLGIRRWPKKLAAWWHLPFEEFTDILKPGKLTAEQRLDLPGLFRAATSRAQPVADRIKQARTSVDLIVDRLYGLSPDVK